MMLMIYSTIHFYQTITCLTFCNLQDQNPTKTLIDNVFFNSDEYKSSSGNLLVEISDHLVQYLIIEDYLNKAKTPKKEIFKRDFKNFNERKFNEEVINKVNWEATCQIHLNDPNLSCKMFYDTLNFFLDKRAPYRKLTNIEIELIEKP